MKGHLLNLEASPPKHKPPILTIYPPLLRQRIDHHGKAAARKAKAFNAAECTPLAEMRLPGRGLLHMLQTEEPS
ncbi:hypothetical protein [Halomonas sp. E19]|uniref:hypothetical protein n=1 Tax=Halomonas sp. E19 TaxID=3397247 RepID=UPI00403392E7